MKRGHEILPGVRIDFPESRNMTPPFVAKNLPDTGLGERRTATVKWNNGDDHYKKIGKLGGEILLEERGQQYFAEIAKRGGDANKNKYGPGRFSELGKKGGQATKERHADDPFYYSRIGRMGGRGKKKNT